MLYFSACDHGDEIKGGFIFWVLCTSLLVSTIVILNAVNDF